MATASTFDEGDHTDFEISDDVEAIFRRQDEAMALLERLRAEEPYLRPKTEPTGGGRRDFRRWPTPDGVTLEFHDGTQWQITNCLDMGMGGARVEGLPEGIEGPLPARLRAPEVGAILVLADVMWKDSSNRAGLRFEFGDDIERDQWGGGLIDALLARHALK